MLLLFAGAGVVAVAPPPSTGAAGAGGVTVIRSRDILEMGRWQAELDNEEIALILALL